MRVGIASFHFRRQFVNLSTGSTSISGRFVTEPGRREAKPARAADALARRLGHARAYICQSPLPRQGHWDSQNGYESSQLLVGDFSLALLESLGDMLARSDMLAKADGTNVEPRQITIKFADTSICPSCGYAWNEWNERERL
jgi:hypothetical protein